MKKEDIEKILEEADNKLGNLTDKQLSQYVSDSHKKQFDKIVVKGGEVMGKNHYKNNTGLFGMSKKKTKQTKINGGKAAGKLAVERGTVIKAGKISAKSKKHPNNVKVKCEHCGFKTTLPLYKRWHGENCKHK